MPATLATLQQQLVTLTRTVKDLAATARAVTDGAEVDTFEAVRPMDRPVPANDAEEVANSGGASSSKDHEAPANDAEEVVSTPIHFTFTT